MGTLRIIKKSCQVNPLKKSPLLGASMVFLGIDGALSLHHGSQGCTAFTKNLLTAHFREITPMQTTATNDIATILGGSNLDEGLINIIKKHNPSLIAILSTGLVETRGDDIGGEIRDFFELHPGYNTLPIVHVSTPDFKGDAESGYTNAVCSVVESLIAKNNHMNKKQVNVLASMMLTPGDIDEIKEIITSFGLTPIVLPDLSSMSGETDHYYTTPEGGVFVNNLSEMSNSMYTIAIGHSMTKPAEIINRKLNIPYKVFNSLTGVMPVDQLLSFLSEISNEPVPDKYVIQRKRLIDAMLDSHFYFGGKKIAIGLEPDHLYAITYFIKTELGINIECAITTCDSDIIEQIPVFEVMIGDLEDLENNVGKANLIMTNSNGKIAAERKSLPLYRVGLPIKDMLGYQLKCFVGYKGSANLTYDIGNIFMEEDEECSHKKPDIKEIVL